MSTEDELRNCRQGKTQMKKRIAELTLKLEGNAAFARIAALETELTSLRAFVRTIAGAEGQRCPRCDDAHTVWRDARECAANLVGHDRFAETLSPR